MGYEYFCVYIKWFRKFSDCGIGQFEWNGKWSDNDTKRWNKHKKIAKKVKFVAKDDGSFWMEFDDFLRIFNVIEICDRTTIQNLHLNVNEDAESKYKLGIVKGFFRGCWEFWCCCKGLKNVYCGRTESTTSTRQTQNKWDTKGRQSKTNRFRRSNFQP